MRAVSHLQNNGRLGVFAAGHAIAHLVGQRLAEAVLVERAREVGVDKLAVVERLADDAPHEAEEVQVVSAARLNRCPIC